jgi:hypothetical protein
MKGWRGGLLLLGVTGGFFAFYVWFFWLRGRNAPPGSPIMSAATRASGARQQQSGTFGRR